MSLNQQQTQALRSIAGGLAGSDPRLASMLAIFSQLAAGEEMPAREKIRATAFPQARRLYPRLGWQQAMLMLGRHRRRGQGPQPAVAQRVIQQGRDDVAARGDGGRLPRLGAAQIAPSNSLTVTTDAVRRMSLRAEPYSAASSRRACPASAASPGTVNDRWMLRPRAGPDPATTRTSHTPGLRWRTDPVPRSDLFAADARSL